MNPLVEILKDALQRIVALDPETDSCSGFNEWGEAECFRVAQEIAEKALQECPDARGSTPDKAIAK